MHGTFDDPPGHHQTATAVPRATLTVSVQSTSLSRVPSALKTVAVPPVAFVAVLPTRDPCGKETGHVAARSPAHGHCIVYLVMADANSNPNDTPLLSTQMVSRLAQTRADGDGPRAVWRLQREEGRFSLHTRNVGGEQLSRYRQ